MIKEFSDWLYATPFSHVIQTTVWMIPVIQTVHIVCLSVLFTSMAMLDLRLLGLVGTRHSIKATAQRFLPWLWGTLPILLISGSLLIAAEPNRDLHNVAFYSKMSMIVIAIAITLGLLKLLKKDPFKEDLPPKYRRLGGVIGLVSLVLWISIIVAGRLIAYV